MALKLNLSGVYISSYNKDIRFNCFQYKKFQIAGSAHNLLEVNIKKVQKFQKYLFLQFLNIKKNSFGIINVEVFSKIEVTKNCVSGINKSNLNLLSLTDLGFAFGFFLKKGPK